VSVSTSERLDNGRETNEAADRTDMSDVPRDPPADVPEEHMERARELQFQLLALEAQLGNANFEDKEAYRRKINEKRGELRALKRG